MPLVKASLPKTDDRFRLLVENVIDHGIFMLTPYGYVMTWNPGAERMTGYTAEEIIGRHFSLFYAPNEIEKNKPQADLDAALANEFVIERRWRMRKDFSRFWANLSISAIRNHRDAVVGFSCVLRDGTARDGNGAKARGISEQLRVLAETMRSRLSNVQASSKITIQKQMRVRRIEAAKLEAEKKANRAKDEFLAVLSHELRTPLTPVLAAASYLADHAESLPADIREELATIRRNAQLEARLIDDLLDFTRIAEGKIELQFEVVNAHRLLREIVEVVGDEIIDKELDLAISLSAPAHWIWADPVRIRQIFWNLIRNAVKFTPVRGHVTIHSANDEQGRFELEVSDSGVGIQPEQMSGVFNAFEQGSQSITREFGGLGLGLTISKKLLDLHRGSISVQSDGKDRGARFKVTLDAMSQNGADEDGANETSPANGRSLRLLLVEDHADTRRTLSRLLSRCGHKVSSTDHVESALKLLDSKRFDAVVSDIELPDRTGYELIKLAKERHHLKGIAVSGFGMEADIRRSLDAGFDHHLTKPVDFRSLTQLLNEI